MATEISNGKHNHEQDKMETDNGVEENDEQLHNGDNNSDQQNEHENSDDADNEDNGTGGDANTGNKRGRKPKIAVDPNSVLTHGQFAAAQASLLRSLTKLIKQNMTPHASNGGNSSSNGTSTATSAGAHTHSNGQNGRGMFLQSNRVEQIRQQSARDKKDDDELSEYIITPLDEHIYHPAVLTKGMNFGKQHLAIALQ
jgi:hypothetical protein